MAVIRYAIFLPVRNGKAYLVEAIDSVVHQTSDDWYLVILDNASTDGSADLALVYNHPRIRVIRSERELTIFESWHRVWTLLEEGFLQAEFMTIIGHDDLLKSNFLSVIDTLRESSPCAGLYQSAFNLIDKKGRLIRPCRPIPGKETSGDFLSSRAWGLRESFGTGYVFRVADYLNVGGIPDLPQLIFADDLLFARLARNGGKVCSEEVSCDYRLHRGSTSGALSVKSICAVIEGLCMYLKHVEEEFPSYWKSARGRAATACLIARESLVFRSVWLRWALPEQTREALTTLAALYEQCADGIEPEQWLGTNFVTRDVYVWSKRMLLLRVLIRSKLIRVQ